MISALKRLMRPAPITPPSMVDGVRAYAITDIHGRADLFANALSWIKQDSANHPDKQIIEIILGDFIDRGMDSKQVIELAASAPIDGHKRICLMGNHEVTLLDVLNDSKIIRSWMNYGGLATLASYGIELPQNMAPDSFEIIRQQFAAAIPNKHLDFLQNLLTDYELGDYYFVHAGVRPNVSLSEQTDRDKMWIREPFLSHKKPFDKYIVHGHTPLTTAMFYPNRVNLDANESTQAVLPCLVLDGRDKHIELIIAD